jgi:predicted nucleic acid-binding protein
MIVVSNTSPLNYLVLIGADHILSMLFGRIVIPPAVGDELGDILAAETVQRWIARKPDWVIVQETILQLLLNMRWLF